MFDQQTEGLSLGMELCLLDEKVGLQWCTAMRKLQNMIEEHERGEVIQLNINEIRQELEGMEVIDKRYYKLCYLKWNNKKVYDDYLQAVAERKEAMKEGVGVRGIKALGQ